MWICPNDETKNKDEDLFCACCGERRPANLDDEGSAEKETVNTKHQEDHKEETDTNSEYRYVYRTAKKHTTTGSAKEERSSSERASSGASQPGKTVRPEQVYKKTSSAAPVYGKTQRRRYLYEKLLWFWYASMLIGLLVFSIGAGAGSELFSFDGKFEDVLSEIWFSLAIIPAAFSFMKRSAHDKTAKAPNWHGALIAIELIMLFIFGLGLTEELRYSHVQKENLIFLLAAVPHIILTIQLIRDRSK